MIQLDVANMTIFDVPYIGVDLYIILILYTPCNFGGEHEWCTPFFHSWWFKDVYYSFIPDVPYDVYIWYTCTYIFDKHFDIYIMEIDSAPMYGTFMFLMYVCMIYDVCMDAYDMRH